MPSSDPAVLLAQHVRHTLGDGPFLAPGGWSHMGAVITDSVLQQRWNYQRQVLPRVEQLQAAWPDATTVSRFRARIAAEGLEQVLHLKPQMKLELIKTLTDRLADAGVETDEDLHRWLDQDTHRATLRLITGIGPKTVDYMGCLVGRDDIAVDMHLRTFAKDAGVSLTDYAGIRAAYSLAADILGHQHSGLEHAVWKHQSTEAGPSTLEPTQPDQKVDHMTETTIPVTGRGDVRLTAAAISEAAAVNRPGRVGTYGVLIEDRLWNPAELVRLALGIPAAQNPFNSQRAIEACHRLNFRTYETPTYAPGGKIIVPDERKRSSDG